jgi:alcohol oxidase
MQIFFQIRPTEAELKEMGPEFNKLWDTYFKDKVRQFNPT